jgi:acyl-CoA thioester hydrolase
MNLRVAPVSLRLHVRPADLDGVGHVNNSVVLQYLEAGRWAWMDHHRLRRAEPVVPVVSRIEVHYLREIPYAELDVSTTMMHLAEIELSDTIDLEEISYRATFRQEVSLVQGGTVAARADVSVAFIDKETRRLCTVQDFMRASVAG